MDNRFTAPLSRVRIGILGAGSLGTVLGAFLIRGGCLVEFIDSDRRQVAALNAGGARVTGGAEFSVPARAVLPEQMEGVYDLVFCLTKQTANHRALPPLIPHLGPGSLAVACQNGLPDEEIGAMLGEAQVLGASVGWGATFVGPGVSQLTSDPDCMHFSVGRPDGTVDDAVRLVQRVLSLMCPTETTDNLLGLRWTKLMMNATFSGLSAVLGCTFGEILDSAPAMDVLARLGRECILTARARGIRMEPMGGHDFEQLLWYEDGAGLARAKANYVCYWTSQRALRASMLQDLEKGRTCEIDYINGAVVRGGAQAGVDTPVNRCVVRLVQEIQAGTRDFGWDNLPILSAALREAGRT